MSGDASFWRNVALIGIAHVAALSGLARWGSAPKQKPIANVLWMDGGAGAQRLQTVAANSTIPDVEEPGTPPPVEIADPPEPEPHSDMPLPPAPAADVPLPSATPKPTPAPPVERPKPTATPPPKPLKKQSPKPASKPSPKKALLAKASPPPTPANRPATPKPSPETEAETKSEPPTPKDVAAAIAEAASTGTTPTVGISGSAPAGSGGRGIGAGGASQFGWYAHMLHDRFFSQWAQPTSVVRSGARMSTLVKLRIEKDGRVSRFTILRPSGNVVVDESVSAVGKRVTQVEPLPSGLGAGGHYEVNINFELNSDQ